MGAKLSQNGEVKKARLDELPGSEDAEFWKDAEVHTNLKPHTEFSEEGHYFELVGGMSAQCKNCHWGFDLDKGDKIIDGHLYNREGKLVI